MLENSIQKSETNNLLFLIAIARQEHLHPNLEEHDHSARPPTMGRIPVQHYP